MIHILYQNPIYTSVTTAQSEEKAFAPPSTETAGDHHYGTTVATSEGQKNCVGKFVVIINC